MVPERIREEAATLEALCKIETRPFISEQIRHCANELRRIAHWLDLEHISHVPRLERSQRVNDPH